MQASTGGYGNVRLLCADFLSPARKFEISTSNQYVMVNYQSLYAVLLLTTHSVFADCLECINKKTKKHRSLTNVAIICCYIQRVFTYTRCLRFHTPHWMRPAVNTQVLGDSGANT